jgi:hypothetical protein
MGFVAMLALCACAASLAIGCGGDDDAPATPVTPGGEATQGTNALPAGLPTAASPAAPAASAAPTQPAAAQSPGAPTAPAAEATARQPFVRIVSVDPPIGSRLRSGETVTVTVEYFATSGFVGVLPWGRDDSGGVGDLLYGASEPVSAAGGTTTFSVTYTGTVVYDDAGHAADEVELCGMAAAIGGLAPPVEQEELQGCALYYIRP